jgi:hypothetical protein
VAELTEAARGALANFLKARPNVELPKHLEKLEGTHGVYVGDGRAEREIQTGFQPTFVVFVVPVYPDKKLPQPAGKGGYWRPELHEQPLYTEKGFKVTDKFNEAGVSHIFIAWKGA